MPRLGFAGIATSKTCPGQCQNITTSPESRLDRRATVGQGSSQHSSIVKKTRSGEGTSLQTRNTSQAQVVGLCRQVVQRGGSFRPNSTGGLPISHISTRQRCISSIEFATSRAVVLPPVSPAVRKRSSDAFKDGPYLPVQAR